MARKTEQSTPARQPLTPSATESETHELRERIERLEQRLEESILGDDGLAAVEGIDRRASGDPLKRAVRRSNVKRGSRKA